MTYDEVDFNRRVVAGYTLQRTNPYGFWIVLDHKGRQVKELGEHTDLRSLQVATEIYIKNHPIPEDKRKKA